MLFFLPQLAGFPPQIAITYIIGLLLALLVGMTVHEWAHNYVAHLMGDPGPQYRGKLTLNPMAHIYWPGFIMFAVIGFGILGSAQISATRMRNPRYGYMAAVAAGPISNLIVAVVAGILFRIVAGLSGVPALGAASWTLAEGLPMLIMIILSQMVLWNLLLFIFNFLPMFPLDGWWIVLALLPARESSWWERNAQNTQFAFFALILIGFATPVSPISWIINPPLNLLMGLILG